MPTVRFEQGKQYVAQRLADGSTVVVEAPASKAHTITVAPDKIKRNAPADYAAGEWRLNIHPSADPRKTSHSASAVR